MYVSPAVRSMREDPIEDESVTLLVEVADEYDPEGDPVDTVAAAVEDAGGTVEDRRRFGTLVVAIAQDRIGAICAIEGLGVVETDNAVTMDPDGAGEDVEYDPD